MTLSQIFPSISGDPALPQLDYAALVAAGVHVPEFIETGLDVDFSFDLPAPTGLRSRISPFQIDTTGKSFSMMDNSAGRYLHISAAGLNGLLSTVQDSEDIFYAGLFLYRPADPAGAIQVLAGSAVNASPQGGEFVAINPAGAILMNVRGTSGPISVSQAALIGAGFDVSWLQHFIFFAKTCQGTGETATHTLHVGTPTGLLTATRTGAKTVATTPRTMAVGNAYNAAENYDVMPVRCGRFMVGRGYRSAAEVLAMYQRAKVVAQRRGMTVF